MTNLFQESKHMKLIQYIYIYIYRRQKQYQYILGIMHISNNNIPYNTNKPGIYILGSITQA
jgi:hypothetical protein